MQLEKKKKNIYTLLAQFVIVKIMSFWSCYTDINNFTLKK